MNEPFGAEPTVLHYLGYDDDRGGIVSVVRALEHAGSFTSVLGVNPGFRQERTPPLLTTEFPAIAGEIINLGTILRARTVAKAVRAWLDAAPDRIFHGHSRAGLLVGLWLMRGGERRVVVSVHCYGKQRWFYRWAAQQLGDRLFWLSPAMRRYYRLENSDTWAQCIPGCLPSVDRPVVRHASTDGIVRIGGVGTLVPWKRWHLVLDAMKRIPRARRERLRFIHVGGDDGTPESRRYAEALKTQTKALRLEELVEWRGPQPSVDSLWSEIDALVVATHREPLSVAMLEALAAGVPVLAANSGGARDVLTPPHNGWFYQSGDVPDLARLLTMLIETDALRRISVEPEPLRLFTAEHVAHQWAEVYARVSGRSVSSASLSVAR